MLKRTTSKICKCKKKGLIDFTMLESTPTLLPMTNTFSWKCTFLAISSFLKSISKLFFSYAKYTYYKRRCRFQSGFDKSYAILATHCGPNTAQHDPALWSLVKSAQRSGEMPKSLPYTSFTVSEGCKWEEKNYNSNDTKNDYHNTCKYYLRADCEAGSGLGMYFHLILEQPMSGSGGQGLYTSTFNRCWEMKQRKRLDKLWEKKAGKE